MFAQQVLLTRADLESALREMGRAVELAPEYGVCVATKLYVQYRFAGLNNDNTAQHKCANEYRKLLKKFSTSPDVFSLYGQVRGRTLSPSHFDNNCQILNFYNIMIEIDAYFRFCFFRF